MSYSQKEEEPSFVVSDLHYHYSSYYKKIQAKQHEMNDGGDTNEYIHDPRIIVITKNFGIVFVRCVNIDDNDKSEKHYNEISHKVKQCKEMLDKDCIFFWRLFQDIFNDSSINFTGILAIPKIGNTTSEKLICR